ncbi:MAG: recombinase family protein [Actinobacteria bacterium]|nr:recombinase family protein [Actinomycetota bacterium]
MIKSLPAVTSNKLINTIYQQALSGRNPETGPIVQEIARRLLAGESLYAVAEDLNSRGVPSPRNVELKRINKPLSSALWDPIQVKRLAITPTNAGLRSLNGTMVGRPSGDGQR